MGKGGGWSNLTGGRGYYKLVGSYCHIRVSYRILSWGGGGGIPPPPTKELCVLTPQCIFHDSYWYGELQIDCLSSNKSPFAA